MTDVYTGDPSTLCERLDRAAAGDPMYAEAAARIRQLERLCRMMTDTGVILEEDVQELIQADTWWLPEDSEYCYTNLTEAMDDVAKPGDVVEWGRSHTLGNCWAVRFAEVRDGGGRVLVQAGVREYDSYQQAEEAAAEYALRRRRAEYGL